MIIRAIKYLREITLQRQKGEKMAAINPYLNFDGNTEEAFNFYKSVFGGDFQNITRFSDTPQGAQMKPEDAKKIMHVSLPIGKGNTLMGTDAVEGMGHKLEYGN